ncbi:hypothetical protein [Salinigranum sp. GCM10025319]|uniref:hypothetical protein n=1 Tax=Salinigranum sp. GCM10025319 TaxID=3252687 RepID=UPI003610BD62
MDKFTLFELHVHDGMEFSATNTAPAIGGSDEEYEELDAVDHDADADDAGDADEGSDGSGRGVGLLGLLAGLVLLAVVAVAIRKFKGGDTELEIADLDDLTDETDGLGAEAESEH